MPKSQRVLVLAADLFEDMELLYPVYRLREEEVDVTIAGLTTDDVAGKKGHGPVKVDATVDGNLISARTPADLGPWMKALLAALDAE